MVNKNCKEKIAILGASRGLGAAIVKELEGENELFLSSRKILSDSPNAIAIKSDFSKPEEQQDLIEKLIDWKPDRVIYCAGGGPHGLFAKKNWKDHQWALEVSFLFPARVLHALLSKNIGSQFVFIGSVIAENEDNELSSSYGAAKRALYGLLESVNASDENTDVRLFSPGYMDTDLLPPNAPPRELFEMLQVEEVSKNLVTWLNEPANNWHVELHNSPR